MFKTNVYKEAFSHMLTNKMTTADYSILNLANEAYPAMPSVDSKLVENHIRTRSPILIHHRNGSLLRTPMMPLSTKRHSILSKD